MKNRVFYKSSVSKDLKRLDQRQRIRIMNRLENELSSDPHAGKPLKGIYKDLYSLRIGDNRVIYALIPDGILVLRIAHRKDVYKS